MATTASVVFGADGGQGIAAERGEVAARRLAQRGELVADAVAGTPQLARRRVDRAAPELSTTSAATVMPLSSTTLADPIAALQRRGVGARAGADRALADALDGCAAGAARCPNDASGRLIEGASGAEVEDHGGGHDRHDVVRRSPPIWKPRPCCSSHAITPPAASRP